MSISDHAPHFALLAGLEQETSSDGRRELLRRVTVALDRTGAAPPAEIEAIDQLLAGAVADYSVEVRAEIARMVACGTGFSRAIESFALDRIEVAEVVLKHSSAIQESTLLRVIAEKPQSHMMAITKRREVSETVSHALVERGSDAVVCSLLKNDGAQIAGATFDAVSRRAEDSAMLQAPLVRRRDLPLDLLNDMYLKVESGLRQEILGRLESVSQEELEAAFQRSRRRVTKNIRTENTNLQGAVRRIDQLARSGDLEPRLLASLLREGASARTAFKVAFARLADVGLEMVDRAVDTGDLDTVALLCRGSGFERALFVALAIGLDRRERALGGADEFGRLYESVPVQAAQRALRFWKVRAAA